MNSEMSPNKTRDAAMTTTCERPSPVKRAAQDDQGSARNPTVELAKTDSGNHAERNWSHLADRISTWGHELGFDAIGISDIDLASEEVQLLNWLDAGHHGEMDYMRRHGVARTRPAQLVPGTVRVITARVNYWPSRARPAREILADSRRAYVARYALGRDYHKVLRSRLATLATRVSTEIGPFGYRVFTDSAPVLEVALAAKSGLGWRGKHTLLLNRNAGSYFFLGEIYTNLPLPITPVTTAHCGTCNACINACPTGAIVAPYQLDARRCISYLTIELKGSIPVELRPLIGNRIYGCDDCQLACPFNRDAAVSSIPDFEQIRNGLDDALLTSLFEWSEAEFLWRTEGSAIRRIGYERWSRNIATALGNAATEPSVVMALEKRADDPSPLVREHVRWALARHTSQSPSGP